MFKLIKDTSMFMTAGDNSGCYLARTKWPAEMLGKEYSAGFPTQDVRAKECKVIQLQRATHEFFLDWIPQAQANGQKIIYDIDDNLFEIPSYNPAFRPYNASLLKQTRTIMSLCDIMTVSTEPLRDYLLEKRIHKNIVVIPNFLHHLPDYREIPNDDKIVIGYHGTFTHSQDFDSKLVFAIMDILKMYDNVYFTCIGYNPLKVKDHPKVTYHKFVDVNLFHDTLFDLNFDIGIAPLKDNIFNKCKSSIKFQEYSYCSTVTVASDVYPYTNAITHGENGFLVKNEKDWYGYLCMLIEDVKLRRALSKNAHTLIDKNVTYKNNGQLIDSLYNDVLKNIL